MATNEQLGISAEPEIQLPKKPSVWDNPIELLGWGWLAAVAPIAKASTDIYLDVDKRKSEDAQRSRERKETEASLQAALAADLQAKNALARSIYSAQIAKQAAAFADADPTDAVKQSTKAKTQEAADHDDAAAKSALAALAGLGTTLSVPLQEKRLATAREIAAKADQDFREKQKITASSKNDPKKYALARAQEKVANAAQQAAQAIVAHLAGNTTAPPSPDISTPPAGTPSESFFERKVLGPFSGLTVTLGSVLLVGGLLLLRRRTP